MPLWEITGFLGHSDTRMFEKHNAPDQLDYQRRPAAAVAEALAEVWFALHLAPQDPLGREVGVG